MTDNMCIVRIFTFRDIMSLFVFTHNGKKAEAFFHFSDRVS